MKDLTLTLIFLVSGIFLAVYYAIDSVFMNPQKYGSEEIYYNGAPASWSSGVYSD